MPAGSMDRTGRQPLFLFGPSLVRAKRFFLRAGAESNKRLGVIPSGSASSEELSRHVLSAPLPCCTLGLVTRSTVGGVPTIGILGRPSFPVFQGMSSISRHPFCLPRNRPTVGQQSCPGVHVVLLQSFVVAPISARVRLNIQLAN